MIAMDHPVTVSGMTAGAILGGFAIKMLEHILGGMAHHKVAKVIEHASRRFIEGELPHNKSLEGALQRAVGQTARVLAFHLHDPERGRLRDLLENVSDWPNFLHRWLEIAQNN